MKAFQTYMILIPAFVFSLIAGAALLTSSLSGCGSAAVLDAELHASGNALQPVSIIELPDITSDSHGFTCTGLTYNVASNTMWAGNFGKAIPDDDVVNPSLVELTSEMKLIQNVPLRELSEKYPESGIQGVSYDERDDAFWVAIGPDIAELDPVGNLLAVYSFKDIGLKPNGLAYDSNTDTLWVLCYNSYLVNVTKDGNRLSFVPCDVPDQDQLAFSADGNLYFTAGADYRGDDNWLYWVDVATGSIKAECRLLGSYAVEGICFYGDKLFVLNDGYYHNALDSRNYVAIYDWV